MSLESIFFTSGPLVGSKPQLDSVDMVQTYSKVLVYATFSWTPLDDEAKLHYVNRPDIK